MRKILVLVSVVFFCLEMQAQVPGYMGKKFLLGYQAQLSPNAYQYVENYKTIPFRFYPKHILSAEYILGRHTSIALEGGYINYNRVINKAGTAQDYTLSGPLIGANIYFFGKRLAPVGNYFSLGVQQIYFTMDDPKGISGNEDRLNIPVSGKLNTTVGSIFFGTRRIFSDYVMVDMALGMGLPYTSFKEGNILLNANSRNEVMDFIFIRNLFAYKIGISGVLF